MCKYLARSKSGSKLIPWSHLSKGFVDIIETWKLSEGHKKYHVVLTLGKLSPCIDYILKLVYMHIGTHKKVDLVAWAVHLFTM